MPTADERATLLRQIVAKMGQSLADETLTPEERHAEAMTMFAHRCAKFALTPAEEDWVQAQVFGSEAAPTVAAPPAKVGAATHNAQSDGTNASGSTFGNDATLAGRDVNQGNVQVSDDRIYGTIVENNPGVIINNMMYKPHLPSERQETPALMKQAQERLAQMPIDRIPDIASLPNGSRVLDYVTKTFVGRTYELQELARILKTGHTTAIATGIGGISKSTLANQFAHRYGQYFINGVFWLSFDNANAVHAEIAACGGKRHLDLHPEFEKLDLADQFGLVQKYWAQAMPCLLILDNCEDEDLLNYLPTGGDFRVLVTSRRSHWNATHGVKIVRLDKLDRLESVSMLRNYKFSGSDQQRADIAKTLDDLPLALHLAGSYLESYDDISVDHYLTSLANISLLQHESLDTEKRSVDRSFSLSYKKLNPAVPTDNCAIQLLERAAYFALGEPISRDLLKRTLDVDVMLLAKAMMRLTKELGLLQTEGEFVRLHRLLADFVQQRISDNTAQTAVEQTMINILSSLFNTNTPIYLKSLEPHFRFVTERALEREDERSATLANSLGYYFHQLHDYAAHPLYERALVIRERILGANHFDTASSLNNLAGLLHTFGNYDAARPMYERALAIRERTLGASHPDTASILNNLAELLRITGNYTEARPMYERALAIREQILGSAHIHTADTLNNFALLLETIGDYVTARPMYEQALTIRRSVLGPNHPDTAQSLNNLAALLEVMGDYTVARSMFERALTIRRSVLGSTHPDTALTLNNLAVLSYNEGHLEEAATLMQNVLAIREQVLGIDHPYTRGSRESLNTIKKALQA